MISRQFVPISVSACASSSAMSSRSGMAMKQALAQSRQDDHSAPTEVGQRLASYLRGLYPFHTAKNVARDTGLSVPSVEKLLERQSAPNSAGFVAFTLAYGPDFLSAVLPRAPGWLDRAVRAERQAQLEREIEDRQRALESLRS